MLEWLMLLAGAALPAQAGNAIPDEAVQQQVTDASYAYFAAKDGGRFDRAYALIGPSMQSYLKPDLFASEAARFNAESGKAAERRVVRLTWYRDPPDAPAPGLYVAADFRSQFPNIHLHCGYLMWHQEQDGSFRIVREEQSFIDKGMAAQLPPERLRTLESQFGCVAP
ncbi:Protein of unknown function [Sphingomonas laterariae]|uniref:DUF4019 domain-containing protein n=1 Tax=Edaphosphingomonas laterariae TaxID=861865 RepID=A0A239BMV1_9SPHN|nr:DUF4019 domain-containing protein [Sphingomonas laterariae]SNS08939.1 Protein of unknown function [Sphingomonas laterariae]